MDNNKTDKKKFEYLISIRDKQIKELKEIVEGLTKTLDIASAYVLLLLNGKPDRRFEVEKSDVSNIVGRVQLKMQSDGSKYVFELVDRPITSSPARVPNKLVKRAGKHPAKRTKK